MLARSALIFVSFVLFSLGAFAEGKLGYSIRTRDGFFRIDIQENNSVREGVWTSTGSRIYLTAYRQDGWLVMPFAQFKNDALEVIEYNENRWSYRGFLFTAITTNIDLYKDAKKGIIRMVGKIGDNLNFNYRTDINKKGQKSAYLYWNEGSNQPEFSIAIKFTSDKNPGSCTGELRVNITKIGRFNCTSSGKLQDAFFTSPDDIVAWLVHLIVIPSDANLLRLAKSQVAKSH